jgi:hypothetical protein
MDEVISRDWGGVIPTKVVSLKPWRFGIREILRSRESYEFQIITILEHPQYTQQTRLAIFFITFD